MLRKINAVSYTREMIAALKNELEQALPREIGLLENSIAQLEKDMREQRTAIENYTQKNIAPLENTKRELEARRSEIDMPLEIAELSVNSERLRANRDALQNKKITDADNLQSCQTRYVRSQERYSRALNAVRESSFSRAVASCKLDVDRASQALSAANYSHECIDGNISRKQSELSNLQFASTLDTIGHMSSHHHHHHHHHGYYSSHHGIGHAVNDAWREASISALQIELRQLNDERVRVCQNVENAKRTLEYKQAALQQANNALIASAANVEYLQAMAHMNVMSSEMEAARLQSTESTVAFNIADTAYNDACHQYGSKVNELAAAKDIVKRSANTTLANKERIEVENELFAVIHNLSIENEAVNKMEVRWQEFNAGLHDQNAALNEKRNRRAVLGSNVFLRQYHELALPRLLDPNLLQSLDMKIDLALQTFENQYPAGQSLNVRLALKDIHAHKAFFCYATNIPAQERYWMLTGLLYNAMSTLAETDVTFTESLRGMLEGHCLEERDALASFLQLKNMNVAQMKATDEFELRQQEAADYQQVLADYEMQLQRQPTAATPQEKLMYEHARDLLKAVKSQEKIKNDLQHPNVKTYDESFDIKFHTNVLNATRQLLNEPWRLDLQNQVYNLSLHNSYGKPSTAKKVAGILTMILGAAIVVSALLLGALTFGLTSPLAIAGIVIGASAFVLGLGVCLSGRQNGVDKTIHGVHSASLFHHAPDGAAPVYQSASAPKFYG